MRTPGGRSQQSPLLFETIEPSTSLLFSTRIYYNHAGHFSSSASNVMHMTQVSQSPEWDYMLFTQQWPEVACLQALSTHTCTINKNITTWTIHGIWPTKTGTRGPVDCDKTKKFNVTLIESIEVQLNSTWPNLYTDTALTNFWKHEYEKHGTCALTLPTLDTEFKYFNTGLTLSAEFHTAQMLAEHGITPDDDRTYVLEEFLAPFTEVYDHRVVLQCAFDKATSKQYVMQLEICLNKTFDVIDCVHKESPHKGYYEVTNTMPMLTQLIFPRSSLGSLDGPVPCTSHQPIIYPTIKYPHVV